MNRHVDSSPLKQQIVQMRGNPNNDPDASIVIPVNARGDLENVMVILTDIARYEGNHTLEIIFVINNYEEGNEPEAVEMYLNMGIEVVAKPSVRRPGEAVGFTARIQGVYVAKSEYVLLFDADCRIPNATALLDWYIGQFRNGADAAYTHVGYYDLRPHSSIRFRMITHHGARWFKREVMGIPTTRGSNYAVRRTRALKYYEDGLLADEMNVGPTFKKFNGKVAYSGNKDLVVLTSGRMFGGGWLKLFRYLLYRLRYNLRVLPVGADVANRTGRENDPERRYINNTPVTDKDRKG
ncbi:MAG: glycosyltransferase family 2 protein [Chloroflexi bacterium]|nr:glycosyltransferase family 2 protein [Chloroflexota bacterium]